MTAPRMFLASMENLTDGQLSRLRRVKGILRDIADNGECDPETKAALEMCCADLAHVAGGEKQEQKIIKH